MDWNLLKNVSKIDRFDASWSSIEKREGQSLKQLRNIATVRSVGASTRIEGSKMSNEEVKALLDNLEITKIEERETAPPDKLTGRASHMLALKLQHRHHRTYRKLTISNIVFTFGPEHFHFYKTNSIGFVFIFCLGLLFSFLYYRFKNLTTIGIWHGIGNIFIDGLEI